VKLLSLRMYASWLMGSSDLSARNPGDIKEFTVRQYTLLNTRRLPLAVWCRRHYPSLEHF